MPPSVVYNVYLVDSSGMPRNHHAIFIETHKHGEGSGFLYQVTGNIQNGMDFDPKDSGPPEESADFGGLKQLLGTINKEGGSKVPEIVTAVRPPKKQFDGPRRMYPDEPLRRCQEWTKEAIQALRDAGALRSQPSSSEKIVNNRVLS